MSPRLEVITDWFKDVRTSVSKCVPSCVKRLPPGGRTRMTEEIGKGTGVLSPGDLNSNNNGETTASYAASYVSNTSSQNDADFIQDNSEYQWFLDYGYREGMHHQVSVLSSLSESYARGLLTSGVDDKACGLYDDLARNLDANLAEVDMENFCAEDIHSLLNTLPTMCDLQKGAESNSQGEMFASISALTSSMMGKFDFDSSLSPHSSSQGEDSAGSIDTMSICKSELLFSPVKESAVPGTINFSVDSLDSDIMLTCQANKDNYTIAFEGSTTMGSEDSEEYHDQGDSETSTDSHNWSKNSRMMNPALAAVLAAEQRLLNSSLTSTGSGKSSKNGCGRPNCKQLLTSSHNNMARSDSTFTTWSKLKKPDAENPLEQQQLSRHPSGNNNTTQGTEEESQPDNTEQTAVKSRSLPNLARQQQQQRQQHQQRIKQQIRASLALSTSSSIESSCVKLYDVRCNGSPLTSSGASSCSGSKPAGGINLVRLFMKQRSGSGTDHSTSVSDCWDSDSCIRSASGPMRRNNNEWQSNGAISQSCRGKQVFRSCQGVEVTRNDNSVDECQCLPEESMTKVNNKLSFRSIDSLNCGHPRKNNGSWVRGEEMTDCSTCTFEDSLYRLEDGAQRTHEQIAEEEAEGPSEHSESVEQVSESISKINSMARDSTLENVHSCDDSSNYSSHHGHVHGLNKTEGDLFHCRRYNVNNNNSLEREDIALDSRRQSPRGSLANCCCCGCENKDCRKHSATQCQLPLINRSMQTSCMLDVLSKATLQEVKVPPKKESALQSAHTEKEEKEDDQTEKGTKPVYVYYPNYALPDLGFLKEKKPNLDLTKVYLRPQKFSATTNTGNADLISKIPACLRQPKKSLKPLRPFSCSDVENLRKKGFNHIQDWNSLSVLLPKEYRILLADIPEVLKHIDAKNLCEPDVHPLFCASAPLKNRHSNPGCECTNLSSASSTNTQPSSGYRGSSTLLTDSSTQSPNYNPLYVYRYDSVSSEASLMGTEKKKPAVSAHAPPLPKRSISLPGAKDGKKNGGNPEVSPQSPVPPRPPLPKGILRTGMDGDVVSNSKMRKEAANKRFSMFEMGAGQNVNVANKRCSLQEPYFLPGQSDRRSRAAGRHEDSACGDDDEGLVVDGSEHHNHHHHHLCSHAEFEDVLRLSDYIHMSTAGLSDVSSESEWDDEKMARLRLQVSRFLSTTGSDTSEPATQQTSKAVSFGSAAKLQPSSTVGEMKTPPNSPNVSALLGNRQYQCKLQQPLSDLPIREEDPGDSSADEHCSAPSSTTPSSHMKPDFESKKALIGAVSDAVEEVISHFSGASTPGECSRLGDSGITPAVANSVIGTLCPALYAVLSDGLLANIATAFGDISNSVWQVVEASAQQGHMTRSLNELVLRLNSEDVFSEGLLKFNAFVFGLLNVRSVDAWMGYLRTRESILRKHYSTEALLVLSLRGGPLYHSLTDSLLAALRPLALLPFHLDLLFECRQLHQSLQRLGAAAATSPTSLLRLVRSIQNSVGQLTIAEEYAPLFKGDISSENPLPEHLELSANSTHLTTPMKRNSRARQLRRPRSCVDPSGDLLDPSNPLRKRWSGVQLGSKLSQALDRLLAEDAEEQDFSDSLNAATPATPQQRVQSDQSTSEDVTLVSHCSDMDNTDTDLSDRSGAAAKARRANALGVGGKFRRLQMKWEKLSGSGTESRDQSTRPSPEASPTKAVRSRPSFSGSTRTSPAMSPVKSTSRSSLHSPGSTTSSTSSMSRIPRPVTSPVRPPTGIPLPRSATSPTQAQNPIRRPSLPPAQGKRPPSVVTRSSRVDQSLAVEPRSPATRPSSLPYSPVGQLDTSKRVSQRRANSASVSRPAPSARKAKPVPRYVRTIKHQLASDSGHLSFSTGERLSLVLEVDEEWLLCCRGDRKGLVRRSAVVATHDHSSRF
ncbi:hypothetical protein FOCC_FOCC011858 [Frankliniella occidentalis]|uniref:Uncharacterized protein LOC113210579 isoform X1 n=1 Tax=Frankliniella occidentalis TaxID=133901 RepID=A0A6J1SU84_FRAOC|nr:uncharacterized protein LOC113210579 isoform X1 [Frankliniella occidentalis]KAE8742564.1 hypothetical protein FOCC_FOCC011858 [Frankliniella occidentalis]